MFNGEHALVGALDLVEDVFTVLDLQLVGKDNGEVSLSWSGGGARRTFTLEAGTTPGAADARVVELAAETSYRVTQVKAGTYYVRVRATNACGTGPASNELVVVVP